MESLAQELGHIDRLLADAMAAPSGVPVSDGDVLDVVQALGALQRRLDGAVVTVTDRIVTADQCERDARLSTRAGCRDAAEVLRRTLLIDGPAARRYVAAAGAVHRETDITSGALLPGTFPESTAALADGFLSVAGFLACTVPLQKARRIGVADRLAADAVLARFATGRPIDSDADADADVSDAGRAPLPTTDELAALAAHIVARLDPDGAEPSDRAGKRRRHFTIGRLRDGSVPVRGELLPEVAAQLQKLVDSLMNPKAEDTGSTVRFRPSDTDGDGDGDWVDGDGCSRGASDRADGLEAHKVPSPPVEAADLRSHAQKRHDAFATILMVAAASGGMPLLGGAAPTLVVSVTATDFAGRTGRARVEGGAQYDVPLGAADHAACAGGIQRVLFDDKGAIVAIGTSARLFNAVQRRAIVLRDRECLIPGCDVPAEWCEIHHVDEHARGGPTHTSNGTNYESALFRNGLTQTVQAIIESGQT